MRLDDINIVSARGRIVKGTINIGVLNTVSKLQPKWSSDRMIIVVDECHKAASDKFSNVLEFPADRKLGLSTTSERPYDEGLRERLVPSLGEVIYQYSYTDALRDRAIVVKDNNARGRCAVDVPRTQQHQFVTLRESLVIAVKP